MKDKTVFSWLALEIHSARWGRGGRGVVWGEANHCLLLDGDARGVRVAGDVACYAER